MTTVIIHLLAITVAGMVAVFKPVWWNNWSAPYENRVIPINSPPTSQKGKPIDF